MRILNELNSSLVQNIVVVVDKTCEIGGDGVIPHPAIGNARWLPVESYKKDGQASAPTLANAPSSLVPQLRILVAPMLLLSVARFSRVMCCGKLDELSPPSSFTSFLLSASVPVSDGLCECTGA